MRTLLLNLSLLFLFGVSLKAHAGGVRDVGNAGDSVEQEFKTLARQVQKDLSHEAGSLFQELTAEDLRQAIEETKVITQEKTILNGEEKDAINYPSLKLIKVSRSRWMKNTLSAEKLRAFVFHEYLGILNIADGDYKISGRLINYYLKSKKRLDIFEISGETLLNGQEDNTFYGKISLTPAGKFLFEGQIDDKKMKCAGVAEFNYGQQILKALMNCNNINTEIFLNYWESDLVDFLRHDQFSLHFTFRQLDKNEQTILEFSQLINGKHR